MNKEYLLSIDGGGSNTVFCLYDCLTGTNSFYYSGSTNYKITPDKDEREIILGGIKKVLADAKASPDQVLGLVMGMSGCDSPSDYQHYLNIASSTQISEHSIYICNDSELTFYSKGTPPGLCIIAGTGSVATGVAKNRTTSRSGGWGSPISDEGSGGWLGIQVLKALLRYCDGYEKPQPVFAKLREFFGVSSYSDLPKMLSQFAMNEIASAARPLMDFADEGDPYCLKLVEQAAGLVADIAFSVYFKLEFSSESKVDIVMAGSLYKSNTFKKAFVEAFEARAGSHNLVFHNDVELPVLGGIILAKEKFYQQT